MIGNNSSGSESIVHGTTIDHVQELEVVLADGSRATFSPKARRTGFERDLRACRAILRDHARAIAEDYPKHWRQSGGYRLDRLDPFDLAKLVVGSEGTLAVVTAATVRLVELPKAKMFAVGHFDDVAGAIAATDDALELEPSAVEMIDRTILVALAREARVPARSPTGSRATRARCCSSASPATREDEVRDKLDQLDAGLGARTATATTRCAPRPRPSRTR